MPCWELNRIVRLPFCLPFPAFVCCFREAITEALKTHTHTQLSVSDVIHQMNESDSEWCESEDMVSSDVEGEVGSFRFTQED